MTKKEQPDIPKGYHAVPSIGSFGQGFAPDIPQEQQPEKCELILDHSPVWAGDGYFCNKCMLEFVPGLTLKERAIFHPQPPNSPIQESKKVVSPTQPTIRESWQNRFDQEFGEDQYGGKQAFRQGKVKPFIESLIKEVRGEARHQARLDVRDGSGLCSRHQIPEHDCVTCFPLSQLASDKGDV